jgi:hypothetical protein
LPSAPEEFKIAQAVEGSGEANHKTVFQGPGQRRRPESVGFDDCRGTIGRDEASRGETKKESTRKEVEESEHTEGSVSTSH